MGLVIRQSFKSTLLTYVGVGLGALNLLFFFPRYLNPELIGLRELLLVTNPKNPRKCQFLYTQKTTTASTPRALWKPLVMVPMWQP